MNVLEGPAVLRTAVTLLEAMYVLVEMDFISRQMVAPVSVCTTNHNSVKLANFSQYSAPQ